MEPPQLRGFLILFAFKLRHYHFLGALFTQKIFYISLFPGIKWKFKL
jgi:hypothetical protein